MINQELINYLKTRLYDGVERGKITSDLLEVGSWTLKEIDDAFNYLDQNTTMQISSKEISSTLNRAPSTIKLFEFLMYSSFLIVIVSWFLFFSSNGFERFLIVTAIPVSIIAFKLFCVYNVVYNRKNWARIVLILLTLILITQFFYQIYVFSNQGFFDLNLKNFLTSTAPIILEIVAILLLFTSSSKLWLKNGIQTFGQIIYVSDNKKWTKIIPRINIFFMVISTMLVFILDLFIVISSVDLFLFFLAMLVVFIIFVLIFFYENRILNKRFSNSISKIDNWFVALVVLRNIVFILNFIPMIQILGGFILIFGGIPYIIFYYILLQSRNRSSTAV